MATSKHNNRNNDPDERDESVPPLPPLPPLRALPVVDPMRTPVALTEPDAPVVTAMGPLEPEPAHSHVPANYQSGTGFRVGLFALVLVIALAVVLGLGLRSRHRADEARLAELKKQAEESLPIDVVRVHRGSPESLLTLPGEARAFYDTTIFARTSGYVDKWFVDIGDHVKKDEVLATIETPDLDAQLVAAKAKLESLKSEVNVAKATAEFAKVSYRRFEAAFAGGNPDPQQGPAQASGPVPAPAPALPIGAVSEQERDQKKSEMDESDAKLAAAQAQVALGQADVDRLTTLTDFKKVRAPFEGVITKRLVDIGALVTAGSTTNTTPLYEIRKYDQMRVFVDVPQAAVPDIQLNMEATAQTPQLPGHKFVGHVDRTSSAVDPVSRTLKVEVLVPNDTKPQLMPGMFVRVTFQTTRTNPPVRIPASGVNFKPGGPQVAVVGPDGRVQFHDIQIERDLGDYVEIESGVSDGQAVALNIGNEVADGEKVEAHEVDLAPPAPPAGPSAPSPARGAGAATAAAVGSGAR